MVLGIPGVSSLILWDLKISWSLLLLLWEIVIVLSMNNLLYREDPFYYPYSPLMRCKKFSNFIHKSFEYFWKSGKYNDAGWLVLESLDKVVKENNELKISLGNLKFSVGENKLVKENKELEDLNSQFQAHMKNLKAFKCILKDCRNTGPHNSIGRATA